MQNVKSLILFFVLNATVWGTLHQWAALNCSPVLRVLYDITDRSFPIYVCDVTYNVHQILHKFQYFVYPFVEEAYQNEGFW